MKEIILPNAHFSYRDGSLYCEEVSLVELANRYGTPLYVYSKASLLEAFGRFQVALGNYPHIICYAVKANSNIALLQLLARCDCGFDVVSGGELLRVHKAGGDMNKVTFSGVGKTEEEMRLALSLGIRSFNIESEPEMKRLARVAASLRMVAPISIRINPDVDAHTHPYISTGLKQNKFGVDPATAISLYREASQAPWLNPVGIDCHIGSQLTDPAPYYESCDKVLDLLDLLRVDGIELSHIDFGGGIGVRYRDEQTIDLNELVDTLHQKLRARGYENLEMIFEPGRSLIAAAGALLTRIQYIKHTPNKSFLIADASMAEMIRPALYEAWMPILPVEIHEDFPEHVYDIVGPVCESSDWLGKQRALRVKNDDLLVMTMAGAYGMSMASRYNSRLLSAEILVDGFQTHMIRSRDRYENLWENESLLSKIDEPDS